MFERFQQWIISLINDNVQEPVGRTTKQRGMKVVIKTDMKHQSRSHQEDEDTQSTQL